MTICRALLVCVISVIFAAPLAAQDNEPLRVLTRTDYIDPHVVAEFTQRTGILVEINIYDGSDSEDFQNLLAGRSGFDLVLVPANLLNLLAQSDAVLPLTTRFEIENSKYISKQILRFLIQYNFGRDKPLRIYGIPFLWGTTGIAYNKAEFRKRAGADRPDGLRFIFDPEMVSRFADCGVRLPDAPGEMIHTALRYKGEDPTTDDLRLIRTAEATLLAIRPYISGLHAGDVIPALANGEICLAMAWSGDALAAILLASQTGTGVDIGFVDPVDGGPIFFDLFAIPSNSDQSEDAVQFIDFLLTPEVTARISRYSLYPSVNAGANNMNWWIGLFDDRTLIPSWDIINSRFLVPPFDEKSLAVTSEIWENFKADPGEAEPNE